MSSTVETMIMRQQQQQESLSPSSCTAHGEDEKTYHCHHLEIVGLRATSSPSRLMNDDDHNDDQQQQEKTYGMNQLHCFHNYKTGIHDGEEDCENCDGVVQSRHKGEDVLYHHRQPSTKALTQFNNGCDELTTDSDHHPPSVAAVSTTSSSSSSSVSSWSISSSIRSQGNSQRNHSAATSRSDNILCDLSDSLRMMCLQEEDVNNPTLIGVLEDLQKAHDDHIRTGGESHTKLAEAWNSLGLVRLHTQKDASAALTCHEHALIILQQQHQHQLRQFADRTSNIFQQNQIQRNQTNQALTLQDIGQCLERLNDTSTALERYHDALRMFQVELGYSEDSHKVSSTQRAIDRICRNLRR